MNKINFIFYILKESISFFFLHPTLEMTYFHALECCCKMHFIKCKKKKKTAKLKQLLSRSIRLVIFFYVVFVY